MAAHRPLGKVASVRRLDKEGRGQAVPGERLDEKAQRLTLALDHAGDPPVD